MINPIARPLSWGEKTLTVRRTRELEACQNDLKGFPETFLFDPLATDADAEILYDLSWDALESRRLNPMRRGETALHTLEELRSRVAGQFSREMALLSPDEHTLLARAAIFGGMTHLTDAGDMYPARGLVRRLLCGFSAMTGRLTLPQPLRMQALINLTEDAHQKAREALEPFNESVDNSLYLWGVLQADAPLSRLRDLFRGTPIEGDDTLYMRYLTATWSHIRTASGQVFLVHPGLAEPEQLLARYARSPLKNALLSMSEESLHEASVAVDELEEPLYDRLLGLIAEDTRPELDPEDTIEDLILLAKQDAPKEELAGILASMLVSPASEDTQRALTSLWEHVPRWLSLHAMRVQ